jgi:PAS domain-containing protein
MQEEQVAPRANRDPMAGPYATYVRRLGGEPGTEYEPVLEALPYGAYVIDILGRVMCVNRRHAALTGMAHGMTLGEVIELGMLRTLDGRALSEEELPEAQVLLDGAEIGQELLRLRSPTHDREVVLAVDARPVLALDGRVVGAVVIAREVDEQIALAIAVRQANERVATVDARLQPELV